MSDELPARVGKYRIIAKLGQGGMARVMLAMTLGPAGFQKLMVIKQLREDVADDPEFLTMFLDEARIAARLNHPNVVQTYEVGEDDGSYFIAMDYLEGQPLNRILHRIGREKMPRALHLRILAEALAGLHYAHELADFDGTPLDVVHRDVSPHNLFVTYDGQVKLVDFGIAKAVGGAALTREGVFKGKVGYMAPEQARGEKVDRRADIFSVGIMLWEALAQERMTRGQEDIVVLNNRIRGSDPKVAEVAPNTPEELQLICERAMALKPSDRYGTAAEFRDAIEGYLETSGAKVGARKIAEQLRAEFAVDREKIKAKIERQVKLYEEAASSDRVPIVDIMSEPTVDGTPSGTPLSRKSRPGVLDPEGTAATVVREDDGDDGPRSDTLAAAKFATEAPVPERPASAKRWALVALVAAVATVAAALTLRPRAGGEVAADSQPTTTEATRTTASESTKITLEIDVSPSSATIFLDDAPVATNPFKVEVERDGSLHKIRAEAEGHETEERAVSFDRTLMIHMALRQQASPAASASASATAEPVAPLPVARPTPAKPPPTGDTPTAGTDLSKQKTRTKRPIDDTDPYK